MNSKYSSLTSYCRGFQVQSDYESGPHWREVVERDDEVDWSVLMDVNTGYPTAFYHRGRGVESYHQPTGGSADR